MSKVRDAAVAETFGLTRRQVFHMGAGGMAALAFAMAPRRSWAMGKVALKDGEATIVSDGTLTLPLSFVAGGAPKAELDALLAANNMATDAIRPDCNVTFWKSGDRLVVFDAGSGSNFMPTAGKLVENLGEAGIDPAAVTDVVFTHAHPDHLWGMIDDLDEPVFPEAAYHIGEAEWAFWTDPETVNRIDEGRKTFAAGAMSRLKTIADKVNMIKPGAEVLPGIEAVASHGHTPGHLCFMIHGGGDPLIVTGDAISNAVLSFRKPEWPSGSDQDAEMAIKTRVALLDRLAADKARIIGYHLPHPGAGRVEKDGTAYRFAAE